MRNFLRVVWMSLVETFIIIVTLLSIIRINVTIELRYLIYGITAIIIPLALMLLYKKLFGRDTLVLLPVSLIVSTLYSLAVSLYSYYGGSSFSRMFNELMYFIYFLPSVIYCGMGWVIFAFFAKISRRTRRSEL